jgi:hypothetical protein
MVQRVLTLNGPCGITGLTQRGFVMDMEEWHYINVVKPKQDWARVSQQAKIKKVLNKKSKRDIEREDRIEALGGIRIEVEYGTPLTEEDRILRKEVEWDLKYPKRKEKRQTKPKRKQPKKRQFGADRTPQEFLESLLIGAKTRATAKGIPFDITPEDLNLPEVCPVLGIRLSWGSVISNETPSIDRVIPELGYVKGNCNIISMKANRLKNNASKEELEAILAYITSH